jgi:uncharacterized protein YdaL
MQRVNVRVRYPIDEVTSATASLIEDIAEAHKGIWWCGGNLSDVTAESNFAFGSRQSAFGFMLRINCFKFAFAVIDFEENDLSE